MAKRPDKELLTAAVDEAILALQGVQLAAGRIDKARHQAEQKAEEAVKTAKEAREERAEAVGKLSGGEQVAVDATAKTIAQLEAEEEQLARRDREARDELERLRLQLNGIQRRERERTA